MSGHIPQTDKQRVFLLSETKKKWPSTSEVRYKPRSLLPSRATRERILVSFRRREKSRFFVKTAKWPPL